MYVRSKLKPEVNDVLSDDDIMRFIIARKYQNNPAIGFINLWFNWYAFYYYY